MDNSPDQHFDVDAWRDAIRRREIKRCAMALGKLAHGIQFTEDYITLTPRILAAIIAETAFIIADAVDRKVQSEDLGIVNELVALLTSHLRYVERARVAHTPWSIVQSAEALLKEAAGQDHHFIIRPTWSYNYTILGDFWESYRRQFEKFPWFPLSDLIVRVKKNVILPDDAKIYCVSFPRIERVNCLLHTNWGHEVGHLIVARWVRDSFTGLWAASLPEVKKRLEQYIRDNPPPMDPLFKEFAIQQMIASLSNETTNCARQGFVELLCDCVGIHLFGAPALASALEFAARFALDTPPLAAGNYPPWRYRIRKMSAYCNDDLTALKTAANTDLCLKPLLNLLSSAKDIATQTLDQQAIDGKITTKLAYEFIEQHWNKAITEVMAMLPASLSRPYSLQDRQNIICALITRIENGIPPNEYNNGHLGSPAALQDILAAGWAYKASEINKKPSWGSSEETDLLGRLVLKGVENSFVHATWGNKIGKAVS